MTQKKAIILFAIVLLLVISLEAKDVEAKSFLSKAFNAVGGVLSGVVNVIGGGSFDEGFKKFVTDKVSTTPLSPAPEAGFKDFSEAISSSDNNLIKNIDLQGAHEVKKIFSTHCSTNDYSFKYSFFRNNELIYLINSRTYEGKGYDVSANSEGKCNSDEVELKNITVKEITEKGYPVADKVTVEISTDKVYESNFVVRVNETGVPLSNFISSDEKSHTFSGPILLYSTKLNSVVEFNNLKAILERPNDEPNNSRSSSAQATINLCDASIQEPRCLLKKDNLEKHSQLWILDTDTSNTLSNSLASIKSFRENFGGSLLIASKEGFTTNISEDPKGRIVVEHLVDKFINSNLPEYGTDNKLSTPKDNSYVYIRNIAEYLELDPYKNQKVCEKRKGLNGDFAVWTGSNCCGLADKENRNWYYNDSVGFIPDGETEKQYGGCWNNAFVASGKFPTKTITDAQNNELKIDIKNVINTNGTFYYCKTLFLEPSVQIASSKSIFTNIAVSSCGKLTTSNGDFKADNKYVNCNYTGEFELKSQSELFDITPKKALWDVTNKENCCSINQCFNSTKCVGKDNNDENIFKNNDNLYFCNKDSPKNTAEWDELFLKSTPDDETKVGDEKYYCKQQTQCLVQPREFSKESHDGDLTNIYSTDNKKPHCINSGQYFEDKYCNAGVWTSRTKFLVDQLLSQANTDFELVCGDATNVLNDFSGGYFGAYNNNYEKTNNVCILRAGDKKFFGATLNTPINNADSSLLPAISGVERTACKDIDTSKTTFEKCTTPNGKKIFYNPSINATIFAPQDETMSTTSDKIQTEFNSIKEFVESLKVSVLSEDDKENAEYQKYKLINQVKYFDTIFYQKKNGKTVFGFLEKKRKETQSAAYHPFFMGIKYTNTGKPLGLQDCTELQNTVKIGSTKSICTPQSDSIFLLMTADESKDQEMKRVWNDLTQKLRIT